MLLEQLLVACVADCCYDFEHGGTVFTDDSFVRVMNIKIRFTEQIQ